MSDAQSATEDPANEDLLKRALRLFEFLAALQQTKTRPVLNLDSYKEDGLVLWLGQLPKHPAILNPIGGSRRIAAQELSLLTQECEEQVL
jgi:hypothetical protein